MTETEAASKSSCGKHCDYCKGGTCRCGVFTTVALVVLIAGGVFLGWVLWGGGGSADELSVPAVETESGEPVSEAAPAEEEALLVPGSDSEVVDFMTREQDEPEAEVLREDRLLRIGPAGPETGVEPDSVVNREVPYTGAEPEPLDPEVSTVSRYGRIAREIEGVVEALDRLESRLSEAVAGQSVEP